MTADIPVKEIMTREVCTVSKEDTVLNASRKMIEYGVGSVVVVEESKPVGIVTERDIIVKVVSRNRVPAEVTVEEIMNYPLITVTPETSAREAGRIMLRKGIRRLPVVNGDALVGIVTDTDLLSYSIDLGEYMGLIREETYIREDVEIGKCEKCGRIAELIDADGMKVCEDCYETI
ncbi:CBS domain-containing protein [Geoglobus sp.]